MSEKKSIVLQLTILIVAILAIIFGISVIVLDDPWVFAKGLAFGGIFSILKVKLMESTMKKAVKKDPAKAQAYASLHYFLRYLLTGIVLVIGALEPSISLLGTVIGILSLKLAAYLQGYREKPTPKDGSVEFVEWEEDEEETSDF